MKKLFVAVFFLIFGLSSFAQEEAYLIYFVTPTNGTTYYYHGPTTFVTVNYEIVFATGIIYVNNTLKIKVDFPDGTTSGWKSSGTTGSFTTTQRGTFHIQAKASFYDMWGSQFETTSLLITFYCVNDYIYPPKPTNPQVTASSTQHPSISWVNTAGNNITGNKIYKYASAETGWAYLAAPSSSPYIDMNESTNIIQYSHTVKYRVTAVNSYGCESEPSDEVSILVRGANIDKQPVGNISSVPRSFSLEQNYPNPFNPATNISYSIDKKGMVQLKVYNVLGKEVAALVNEYKEPGQYTVSFNASALPTGMYTYSLMVNGNTAFRKMTLIK